VIELHCCGRPASLGIGQSGAFLFVKVDIEPGLTVAAHIGADRVVSLGLPAHLSDPNLELLASILRELSDVGQWWAYYQAQGS
jgi:hypothetical protein